MPSVFSRIYQDSRCKLHTSNLSNLDIPILSDRFYIDVVHSDGVERRLSIILPKQIKSISISHENFNTYPWDDDDPDEDGVFLRRTL